MSRVETQYRLNMQHFNRNLDKGVRDVRSKTARMKKDARGVGSSMSAGFSGLKNVLAGIGLGMGVRGAFSFLKDTLQRADDIADLTLKLNESAEAVQRVDFVSKQAASVGVEQLAKGFLQLEKNMSDTKSSTYKDALDALGFSAEELAAMGLEEKIFALSDAFQKARESGTGTKAIMDLLGRSGAELIPLLEQSRGSLESLFEKSQEQIISDSDIAQAAKLNDEFDAMVSKVTVIGQKLALDFAEGFEFLRSGLDVDAFVQKSKKEAIAQKEREKDRKSKLSEIDFSAGSGSGATQVAERLEKAATELERIKQTLADAELDLLPDAEKVAAFDQKIKGLLAEMKANFPFFDESLQGVQDLADFRESQGDDAGAAEALTLLKDLRDLTRDRDEAQESIDEAAADKADALAEAARQKNEETLREQVRRQQALVDSGSVVNASGTAAGAIEQIFGRDASQLQLAATKEQTAKLAALQKTLEEIQKLNEEDLPPLELKIK